MTGKPLRLTICAVLAIIIAASVAIALRLSSAPPANNQSATPSAIATSGQLTAFLPRRAGNLQLENLKSGPLDPMVSLPECLLPPNNADGFPPAAALPKLDYDINEPIASGTYSSHNYGFSVELFRYSQSKLPEVTRLLRSAPASCTRTKPVSTGVDVNVKLGVTLGDGTAAYQTYFATAPSETYIRTPENIDLVAMSNSWGITVSTMAGMADARDVLKDASFTARFLPDLLRQLDATLHASFLPSGGTTSALIFPSLTPYLGRAIYSGSPDYKPSKYWISNDSSLYIAQLRWSSWTTGAAVASGIAGVNLCTPNCAGGEWRTYPVQVTLSNPEYACTYLFFGRLKLHWLAGQPPDGTGDVTFQVLPSCLHVSD